MPPRMTTFGELITRLRFLARANFFPCLRGDILDLLPAMTVFSFGNNKGGSYAPLIPDPLCLVKRVLMTPPAYGSGCLVKQFREVCL